MTDLQVPERVDAAPMRWLRLLKGLVTSDASGGVVIRRFLPAAIVVLMAIGFLRFEGERRGLYGPRVGVVIMAISAVVLLVGLLLRLAYRLDRNDAVSLELEGELRRSSRHFELSRDLVCTVGYDGSFRQMSKSWTETLGWTEAELRSRPVLEFVHPDDLEMTLRVFAEVLDGVPTVDYVNRWMTKNGSWIWLEWRTITVPDEKLVFASLRDVTHRRAVEAALEASERQTRQILETAHDAFISADAAGRITEWNFQAQVCFGWTREEAVGRELGEVIVPREFRDAHRKGMARFLATQEKKIMDQTLELTALHRDGHEFPIELTVSALKTDLGYVFHAFLRDITKRKRADQELAHARDEALEASRLKSMFVANVSHEIRTPMNGVIGMTALMLDTGLTDEQREYAQTISASGEALLEIIDDILDFSKIEAGKLELDPVDFDLREAIERASGMPAARAHEKGLELVVAIEPDVPTQVFGDAPRLRQVIMNLVSNAIKFTANGEVVVRVSSTTAADSAALIRVEVSDTGIGIQRKALEQLFNPYTQADGSTTRKYGGTGLGLAISKQLVELMGGRVGADSEPGVGSCFWFELPLPRGGGQEESVEKPNLAGLRVLVVDDNAASRAMLEKKLESWQASCEVADSAVTAMKRLLSAITAGVPYALALLDLNMPGTGGLELAAMIRDIPALRDLKLVVLSPSGVRSELAEDGNFDGSLAKPVRESRVYQEIGAVMAGDRLVAQRIQRLAPVRAADPRTGPGLDILVVDDTPVNQAVAVAMLEKSGFRPHLAGNGREALVALSKRSYAAVLMDCQMPELDGYEATRAIRRNEQGGRTPIIAMTANAMKGERERCLAAGMDDYLTKPLRKGNLEEALLRWVPALSVAAATAGEKVGPNDLPDPGDGPELLHEAVIAELESLEGDMLAELVDLYFNDAVGYLSDLSGAIDRGELVTLGQTAHKLKGSSGSLGAAKVSEIAAELEALAHGGDLGGASAVLARLRSGIDDTQLAFRARIPTQRVS